MDIHAHRSAIEAEIHRVGEFQLQGWKSMSAEHKTIKRDASGDESLVTHYDVESERRLRRFVTTHFPDHSFLGEETEHLERDPDHYWIVDPIDGTTNFTHGIPFWGPSLAYWRRGRPEFGIVHFPVLGNTYVAWRGGGAWLDGERLHTDQASKYSMLTIVALHSRTHLRHFLRLRTKVRIPGSIIANMCGLARGTFTATAGRGRLWDLAAGVLIMQEAGGIVEVDPSLDGLDVRLYAQDPHASAVFQLFARANATLPSLRQFLHTDPTHSR